MQRCALRDPFQTQRVLPPILLARFARPAPLATCRAPSLASLAPLAATRPLSAPRFRALCVLAIFFCPTAAAAPISCPRGLYSFAGSSSCRCPFAMLGGNGTSSCAPNLTVSTLRGTTVCAPLSSFYLQPLSLVSAATWDAGEQLVSLTQPRIFSGQTGAAWSNTPVDLATSFLLSATIVVSGSNGADGVSLVFHTDARGTQAIGGWGGCVGICFNSVQRSPPTITPAFGVVFSTLRVPAPVMRRVQLRDDRFS